MLYYKTKKTRKYQFGGSFWAERYINSRNNPPAPVVVVDQQPALSAPPRPTGPMKSQEEIMADYDAMWEQAEKDYWRDPSKIEKPVVVVNPNEDRYAAFKGAPIRPGEPAGPTVIAAENPFTAMLNKGLPTISSARSPQTLVNPKAAFTLENVMDPSSGVNRYATLGDFSPKQPSETPKDPTPPKDDFNIKGIPADVADKIIKSDYDAKLKKEMLDVARVQTKLQSDHYYSGKIDGMWGKETQRAWERRKAGLKPATYEESEKAAEDYKKLAQSVDIVDQMSTVYAKGGIFYPTKKFQRGGTVAAMQAEQPKRLPKFAKDLAVAPGSNLPPYKAPGIQPPLTQAEKIKKLQKMIRTNEDGVWGDASKRAYQFHKYYGNDAFRKDLDSVYLDTFGKPFQ